MKKIRGQLIASRNKNQKIVTRPTPYILPNYPTPLHTEASKHSDEINTLILYSHFVNG